MTGRIEKTVFISCRRLFAENTEESTEKTNLFTAKARRARRKLIMHEEKSNQFEQDFKS